MIFKFYVFYYVLWGNVLISPSNYRTKVGYHLQHGRDCVCKFKFYFS